MRKALILAWWVGPAVLWACGSGLSTGPGDGGSGTDGGRDGTVVEAGLPDSTSGHDGPTTGDAGVGDAPEEAPTVCLPESTDDSAGLYVVSGGSTGSACGARTMPCATIALALSSAQESPTPVSYIYVGPGAFTESTQLNLLNGVSIVGGWAISASYVWSHTCIAPTIHVTAPVLADNLTTLTTLDTIHIVNSASGATPGGSAYGLFSVGSSLALHDVAISLTGAGGAGASGGSGSMGAGGAASCSAGSGSDGGVGSEGGALGAGAFTDAGYVPASPTSANTGTTGGAGGNGIVPTPVPSTGPIKYCVCSGSPPCLVDCNAPDGGGTYSISGAAGDPGCGGSGGTGGTGGGGGGCSIALYAWGGTVTISGGSLSSGTGGAGGPGGVGGGGGAGTAGTTGASAPIQNSSGIAYCDGIATAHECKYPAEAPGSTGGTGGSGGTGGQGGGGAGGCSYAYYAGGGATVTTSGGASLAPGAGGKGGSPNGSTGPSSAHN